MKEPKYNYEWTIKDATFTKDKGKVFSCFACGGGSTMGYKLSGFDVLGCNEIDPKMIESYRANHKPKYSFLEPIQDFKNRKDSEKINIKTSFSELPNDLMTDVGIVFMTGKNRNGRIVNKNKLISELCIIQQKKLKKKNITYEKILNILDGN